VGLQEIRDAELVEPTIALTVGAKADLLGYLRDRRALLLLDNVEQLLDYAPRLAELLARSSGLKLLTTSREPLHLTMEQQYPVPPLPEGDAVSLFGERARAVRPDYAANGAVAEICRRLDGLPLAIELAAALVKLLPPDALLERLEQRLALLTGGARDLPERQKTLRATIEWSYELLYPREQELLARLSVFAGGWSLEAAEAVCDAELETLASLVDKSLVREREGRFWMLETIREYGLERVAELDPSDEARRRHAAYFLGAAEDRVGKWFVDLPSDILLWFAAEQDNFRVALDWFHAQPDPEPEIRLAIACNRFWLQSGYWTEGRQRLDAARSRADRAAVELRVLVALTVSVFWWRQGDYEGGKALAEEGRALHAEHGLPGPLPGSITLGVCEDLLGNKERAIELYESAASEARADGDDVTLGIVLNNLGNVALARRDLEAARAYIEESAALNRGLGHPNLANDLVDLGFIALAENRSDAAASAFRESLSLGRSEQSSDILFTVEGLAALSLDRGDALEAVRLLAATTRPRAELGFGSDYYTIGEEMREQTMQSAREQLGEDAFAAAWAEGEQLSLQEAGEAASRI
jgi:predicted ATPase